MAEALLLGTSAVSHSSDDAGALDQALSTLVAIAQSEGLALIRHTTGGEQERVGESQVYLGIAVMADERLSPLSPTTFRPSPLVPAELSGDAAARHLLALTYPARQTILTAWGDWLRIVLAARELGLSVGSPELFRIHHEGPLGKR